MDIVQDCRNRGEADRRTEGAIGYQHVAGFASLPALVQAEHIRDTVEAGAFGDSVHAGNVLEVTSGIAVTNQVLQQVGCIAAEYVDENVSAGFQIDDEKTRKARSAW